MYVKYSKLRAAWRQTGWLCEMDATEGQRCLEHLNPPNVQHGQYFYCVVHPDGMKLLSSPDESAPYLPHAIPMGSVIEASDKLTPMDSSTTYVNCHTQQGYFVERYLDGGATTLIRNSDNEILCEAIPCPDALEESCVEVKEVYSVIAPEGTHERLSPYLTAIEGELLTKGTGFTSLCRIEISYVGIGSVIFVQKSDCNKWVMVEAAGRKLLKLVTDSVELGHFTYVVTHEHGVVVLSVPDFNALPKRPHKILHLGNVFQVEEKRMRVEDIVASDSSSPTVFLKIANGEGWVYEMRRNTRICQEAKKNSSVTDMRSDEN